MRIISKKTVVLAALAAGTVIGQSTAVAATPPPVNPLPTVEQVRELTKGKNRTPPPINPLPTKEELDLLKKGEPLPGDAKRDSALSPHAPTLLQDLPPQDVYFANCAEVKNQGKAPLGKDQPGYRITLDPDGDGLACEDREGGDAPQAQGQAPIQPQAAPAPAPVQPQPPAPAAAPAAAAAPSPAPAPAPAPNPEPPIQPQAAPAPAPAAPVPAPQQEQPKVEAQPAPKPVEQPQQTVEAKPVEQQPQQTITVTEKPSTPVTVVQQPKPEEPTVTIVDQDKPTSTDSPKQSAEDIDNEARKALADTLKNKDTGISDVENTMKTIVEKHPSSTIDLLDEIRIVMKQPYDEKTKLDYINTLVDNKGETASRVIANNGHHATKEDGDTQRFDGTPSLKPQRFDGTGNMNKIDAMRDYSQRLFDAFKGLEKDKDGGVKTSEVRKLVRDALKDKKTTDNSNFDYATPHEKDALSLIVDVLASANGKDQETRLNSILSRLNIHPDDKANKNKKTQLVVEEIVKQLEKVKGAYTPGDGGYTFNDK